MTRAEWEHLREGLEGLAPDVRAEVDARIAALADHREGLVTCPMLDVRDGACLVYAHRPAACRTYGFYVRRRDSLHCGIVAQATREMPDVVWGNQESVDDALSRLSGEEISLVDWASRSKPSSAM